MHPLGFLVIICVVLICCVILYRAFLHSPKIDKLAKQLSDEEYVDPHDEPRQVIQDIEEGKEKLESQMSRNKNLAKKAEKQNEAIGKYLNKDGKQEKDSPAPEEA